MLIACAALVVRGLCAPPSEPHSDARVVPWPQQSCGWELWKNSSQAVHAREIGIKNKAAEALEPVPGGAECAAEWARRLLPKGGELDHLPPPGGGAPRRPRFPGGDPVAMRWCGSRHFFFGCRKCGWSCYQFGINCPRGCEVDYPAAQYPPVQVRVTRPAQRNPYAVVLHMYGSERNPAAAKTAARMNWAIEQHAGELPRNECKGGVLSMPTFFLGNLIRGIQVLRENFAHWWEDVLATVFNTISAHLDVTAALSQLEDAPRPAQPFQVVIQTSTQPRKDNGHTPWRSIFAHLPSLHRWPELVEDLFPARRRWQQNHLVTDLCFERAIFDCPKASTMGPVGPLRRWLSFKYGLSYSPLPRGAHHTLLLARRRAHRSRYLHDEVAEQMLRAAQRVGFSADSARLAGVNADGAAPLRELTRVLQRASVIAGLHGAELQLLVFMPAGGVLIEMVAAEFRYWNEWYIRAAAAHGQHLLRWTMPRGAYAYHTLSDAELDQRVAHLRDPGKRYRARGRLADRQQRLALGWRGGVRFEEAAFYIASTFRPSITEWEAVLRSARHLLA